MNEIYLTFQNNPVYTIGCLLVILGVIIFVFGKKLLLFRWFLGDRSMFSQMFYGLLFTGIGLFMILTFRN
ncbi:hypothetical protein [Enterococcus faecium]|uniref:hypothetical protein n=1 Tax=Enterococcus faecium TaxID=1352 RepID=UPI000BEF9ACC|nr:hypothetical protein [Enterococcus faecium]PEH49518.1 hypothetical protein CRM75_01825 [Enterococcus faecium]